MAEDVEPREDDLEPRPTESSLSIPSTQEDRQMGLFCHLGGALFSWPVPLIIWLIKKDQSKFVDDQGKEALNFQITLMIGHLIGGLTICLTWGLLNMAVWVLGLVFGILGGMEANKGVVYRYPFNIRLIK
jgi:uncharacterized Tic20 family protein